MAEPANDFDGIRFQRRTLDELLQSSISPTPPLQHGGGGGTSGSGMETRIAVLEADMAHVKADLGELKADVRGLHTGVGDLRVSIGRLEERVAHLPTITMMWSAVIAIVLALGGVIALAVRFIPHAS